MAPARYRSQPSGGWAVTPQTTPKTTHNRVMFRTRLPRRGSEFGDSERGCGSGRWFGTVTVGCSADKGSKWHAGGTLKTTLRPGGRQIPSAASSGLILRCLHPEDAPTKGHKGLSAEVDSVKAEGVRAQ